MAFALLRVCRAQRKETRPTYLTFKHPAQYAEYRYCALSLALRIRLYELRVAPYELYGFYSLFPPFYRAFG